ncbi:MAG: hypothetical protein ACI4BH_09870 [Muribaculaceae bacterium]
MSKNANQIDPNWSNIRNRHFVLRPFLVAGVFLLLIALAVFMSFFKSCTSLGEVAKEDVYSPVKENKGFVAKADLLLEELLADCDETVVAVDLKSLNKKYPSLIFALPYAMDDATCIEGGDLRLVGINNDKIKDKWKQFYFNSRLQQLLQQQSDNRSETYFSIKLRSESKKGKLDLNVESIKLIPSMFKVALSKDPWTGTIVANDNGLFNDENSVYLTYGNTVLPLHRNRSGRMSDALKVYVVGSELKLNKRDRHFNYYDYYQKTYKTDRSVSIPLTSDVRDVNFCCKGNTLVISSLYTFKYGRGKEQSGRNVRIPIRDGEKLVFYDNSSNKKLAEFTVNTHNPALTLSSIIRSNLGSSRYNIARSQTDLFTQQMIRGLSRHLSNKDSVNDVNITIDPLLSKEFEDDLIKSIYDARREIGDYKSEYDISLTIMDLATGNVLASPFYMTRFEKELSDESLQLITKNVSLRRRYIGSTFKPMLALAAVLSNSDLLSLNTPGMVSIQPGDEFVNFHGRKSKLWASKVRSHWGGTNFTDFISHSDDVYPVSLAALAMSQATGNYGTLSLGEKSVFCMNNGLLYLKKDKLDVNNPFPYWLSQLYVANYNSESSSDLQLWRGLYAGNDVENQESGPFDDCFGIDGRAKSDNYRDRNFGLEEISPDITNLHLNQLYEGGEFRTTLVPFVLGQGSNEWNCIKLAEAWCRMIGKRDVRAHFIKHDVVDADRIYSGEEEMRPSVRGNRSMQQVSATWNQFLEKFEAAQVGSLLGKMKTAVRNLNSSVGEDLVLFSKTGTPDEYVRNELPMLMASRRGLDVGMYTFALVKRSELNKIKAGQPGKGIVCVVRMNRTYDSRRNKTDGLSSSKARDFFSAHPERLRKLYDMTKNYY